MAAPLWSSVWIADRAPGLSFDERLPRACTVTTGVCACGAASTVARPQCPGLVAGLDRGGSCAGVSTEFRQTPSAASSCSSGSGNDDQLISPRHLDAAWKTAPWFRQWRSCPARRANYPAAWRDSRSRRLCRGSCGRYGTASSTSSTRCAHCAPRHRRSAPGAARAPRRRRQCGLALRCRRLESGHGRNRRPAPRLHEGRARRRARRPRSIGQFARWWDEATRSQLSGANAMISRRPTAKAGLPPAPYCSRL